MITPSFGLTATERVLPKLALDFTTASLDSRVTFTRSGNTATVTNSNGIITAVNANIPRFDYDPSTLTCKGLLIEETRTNILIYSADFTNASWVKTNTTVTGAAATAPDNTNSGCKLIATAVSGQHSVRLSNTYSVPANTAGSLSIYAKAAEYNTIAFAATGASAFQVTFTLTGAGSISGLSGGTATITSVGNGWYRCTYTATTTAYDFVPYIYCKQYSSFTGDGTSGLYIWGAQLEAGSFATSYIPTVASQVTRTADVATMTGTNFSSWFNASQGAFAVTAICKSTPTAGKFPYTLHCLSTAGNDINLYQNGATSQQAFIRVSNTGQATLNSTVVAANTLYTQVAAYKQDSFAGCVNAGTVQTDISGNVPTLTTMYIGAASTPTFELNGWVQKLNYWPQRVINAEVQAFSK